MRTMDDFWFDGKLICSKRVRVGKPEPKQVFIEAVHFKGGGYRVAYSVDESNFRDYGRPKCKRDAGQMVRGLARRLKSGKEVVEGNRIIGRAAA